MSVLSPAPAVTAPERRRLMGSAYDLSGATDATSARVAAGLDWEAIHVPLFAEMPDHLRIDDEKFDLMPKDRAVIRDDNGEKFGVVGAEHQILTNEALFDFADTLLEEAGLTWATSQPFGGARADGRSPFLAFQLGDEIRVAGTDAVGCAILLSNGHVGNTAFTLTVTPLRYQCSNVVRAAIVMGKSGKSIAHHTIRHSGDLDEKVKEVRAALAITGIYMAELDEIANRMAAIDMSLADFDDFLTELVPSAHPDAERACQTVADRRAAFRQNWSTPTLTDDLRATRWGALNVVTEVLDHGNLDVRRSSVPAAERRMNSVHFGAGARMRDRAYRLLGGV